jgi:hypothetical protein
VCAAHTHFPADSSLLESRQLKSCKIAYTLVSHEGSAAHKVQALSQIVPADVWSCVLAAARQESLLLRGESGVSGGAAHTLSRKVHQPDAAAHLATALVRH